MNCATRIKWCSRHKPLPPMRATKADAAQAQASQQQQTVGELKSDVTDLKANLANTVVTVQETQKVASESPTALHFKGITITPGGFLAAETVRRSRALAADVNTPFNSITMPGASASNISEFFGSGRQSRVSMLAEGRLASVKLSGYVEADFLSAGVTSNNNQSNSYSLRQRQAWGQAAFDNGWTFTGGQMWSLLTETKHGTDNRTEALPMTIDAQYTAASAGRGNTGLRLSKNFNNKVWFAVSLENSQATISTHNNAEQLSRRLGRRGRRRLQSARSPPAPPRAAPASLPVPRQPATLSTHRPTSSRSWCSSPASDTTKSSACSPASATASSPAKTSLQLPSAAPARHRARPTLRMPSTVPRTAAALAPTPAGRSPTSTSTSDCTAVGGSGIGRYGASGLADASVPCRRNSGSDQELSGIGDSRMARAEGRHLPERGRGVRQPNGRL